MVWVGGLWDFRDTPYVTVSFIFGDPNRNPNHHWLIFGVNIAPGAHVRPSTNIGYLTGLLLGFSFRVLVLGFSFRVLVLGFSFRVLVFRV